MKTLSARIAILGLGLAFLVSMVAAGCGSNNDVQPDAKSNYNQSMQKKKTAGNLD